MQRQFVVDSATLRGVEAQLVTVEVSIGSGLPGIAIVGMPDSSIQEARERVKAAIKHCGFEVPNEKIVVNLAPGTLKKTGSGFDLPIALGILVASGQLPRESVDGMLAVGELSLEGRLREVPGMLAFELCARTHGCGFLCASDAVNIMVIDGLKLRGARSLSDFKSGVFDSPRPRATRLASAELDFRQVGGHDAAKRAIQIAATGNHGLLMMGPPGSGKTMLAERIPSILPELNEVERLQTAQVYSAAGEDIAGIVAGRRPFRHPHHSVSGAGLLGGGTPVRPGEVSLAHNGVCFLDEISQFPASVLQGLRQPMEDGRITIVRAEGAFVFPARFMLVAASNPCPCGYYGDPERSCTCSVTEVVSYQNRIGGPLMDRIDLQIDVWRSDFDKVVHAGDGVSSAELKEGVMKGRAFAEWRRAQKALSVPSERASKDVEDLLERNDVDKEAEGFLRSASKAHVLSGRSIVRTVGIARTIADMGEEEHVGVRHMAEALSYRIRGEKA